MSTHRNFIYKGFTAEGSETIVSAADNACIHRSAGALQVRKQKAALVLNETPAHEDHERSGGVVPCIINLNVGWNGFMYSWPSVPIGQGPG
jgi:hypothetical protein